MARLEAKDVSTEEHTRRVAEWAVQIGEHLGLAPGRLRDLALAGLLHDIGKLSTPDAILTKPGRLTDAEMDVIKRHPVARRATRARARLPGADPPPRPRPPRAPRRLRLPGRPARRPRSTSSPASSPSPTSGTRSSPRASTAAPGRPGAPWPAGRGVGHRLRRALRRRPARDHRRRARGTRRRSGRPARRLTGPAPGVRAETRTVVGGIQSNDRRAPRPVGGRRSAASWPPILRHLHPDHVR